MSADATNLASEFYVLSVLHRLGLNAALTLANRKSVDIILARTEGDAATIDVKGASGTTGFFVGNQMRGKPNHFVIFVTYLNKFADPNVEPEVFIVPSVDVAKLAQFYPKSRKNVIRLKTLRLHQPPYRNAWQTLL